MVLACTVAVAYSGACTPAPDVDPGFVDPGFAAADSMVDDWVRTDRVAGASLVVLDQGRPAHEHSAGVLQRYTYGDGQYPTAEAPSPNGLARLPDSTTVGTDVFFDLASVTKVLATTMAVMLLVDRGQLDVDVPVAEVLPAFAGSGRDEITPRHLLTHTSGLGQWWPVYYHAEDRDEAWRWLSEQQPAWPVGAERHYSDLGFMTLGRIVEEITGERLDHYVQEEIYEPLGLSAHFRPAGADAVPPGPVAATSHGNPFERRMVHDPDFGYEIALETTRWDDWRTHTLVGQVNDGNAWHAFGGVAGHAGLFATASDAAALVQLVLNGGSLAAEEVIGRATVEAFLAPHTPNQALGWQLPAYAPEGSFGHTGFTGTFVLGVPDAGRVVVLLTNRQNPGVDAETQYSDVGPLQRAVTRALTTSPSDGR